MEEAGVEDHRGRCQRVGGCPREAEKGDLVVRYGLVPKGTVN
jgi:hypothetical protein